MPISDVWSMFQFFKKVDESVKALKTELEDLSAKLLAMNKTNSESSGQNGKGDEGGDVDANGVTIAPKRSRSVSDGNLQSIFFPLLTSDWRQSFYCLGWGVVWSFVDF